MRSRLVLIAFALLSAAAACGTLTDPDHNHPGCTETHNSDWTTYIQFGIVHTDPRTCPIALEFGQQGSSGGIVYDLTAPPYGQGLGNAQWLDLGVYDYPSSNYQCSLALASATEFFSWGQPRPGSSALYEWRAERYLSFYRQESPDFTCFEVRLQQSVFLKPRAVITINYYGQQG